VENWNHYYNPAGLAVIPDLQHIMELYSPNPIRVYETLSSLQIWDKVRILLSSSLVVKVYCILLSCKDEVGRESFRFTYVSVSGDECSCNNNNNNHNFVGSFSNTNLYCNLNNRVKYEPLVGE